MTTTSRADFDASIAAGHRVVPVLRELFADGETPVGVYRKLAAGRPGTFLLESAEQGGIWSRFSFVGVDTFGVLTQDGDVADLAATTASRPSARWADDSSVTTRGYRPRSMRSSTSTRAGARPMSTGIRR